MDRDCWETPVDLFNDLNREFNFKIDLCATSENRRCDIYVPDIFDYSPSSATRYIIGDGGSAYMNPPYSNPKPFIEKAWELARKIKVVCLVKVDPSTRWWAVFWDYENHKPRPGCEVRFLPKRVKFVPPKGLQVKSVTPNFASAVVIFDRRGVNNV